MSNYNDYLHEQNYTITTIKDYTTSAQVFIKWCNRNHTTPNQIDYKTALKYIAYLTKKGTSKKTINHRLRIVKNYLNYLVEEGNRSDNPIENTVVKGEQRTIHHNLLSTDELEDLYYSYEIENHRRDYHKYTALRAKAIVGLLVYQGIGTTDLGNLQIEHLQLNKGKIYVPSTKKSNARELELKPWQIMDLINYQTEVRPNIQKHISNYSEQLFPTNARFSSIVHQLTKNLKKYNAKVCDVKQIRASVITNWLGHYNLREVQYLSGHRYISSTERYVQDDLENLHEIVNNFHPIS